MGVIVEYNGQEIWSPSLLVGKLFIDQIKAIERLLDIPSGVNSYEADTLEIDAPTFKTSIHKALQTLETTNNGPLFALMSGCLEIAIALHVKIVGEWPTVSERLEPLLIESKTVMNAIL